MPSILIELHGYNTFLNNCTSKKIITSIELNLSFFIRYNIKIYVQILNDKRLLLLQIGYLTSYFIIRLNAKI